MGKILKKPHSFTFHGMDTVDRSIRWWERWFVLPFLPTRTCLCAGVTIEWKFWRGRHYVLRERARCVKCGAEDRAWRPLGFSEDAPICSECFVESVMERGKSESE